ncbi:hypothetical protein DL771_010067 [Monosporascus sp. 5C6A]|nr:hypothetical protein DL771_010067 [Monosporascus sp. 5C6A]
MPVSVQKARERAHAGLPRGKAPPFPAPSSMSQLPAEDFDAGGPQFARPQAPAGIQTRDGQSAVPISRPTQVPQWPLAGPIPPPPAESEPYRPPPEKFVVEAVNPLLGWIDSRLPVASGCTHRRVHWPTPEKQESVYSDDADESRLVRSASIGKRGKPSLVVTRNSDKSDPLPEAIPKPAQDGTFREGTAYVEGSSSSSGNSSRGAVGGAVTADTMLSAFQAASATDPSSVRNATPSPKPFRLSALRRPPRLDIDAVRDAEARGSLTSLPDLIRRATRLASIMDKGRRPTSRFDELDFPEAIYGSDGDRNTFDREKYQSGLSDMLAAFPPPATGSRQADRQSGNSWPLPFVRRSYRGPDQSGDQPAHGGEQKPKRRCCGMPLWVAIVLLFILLCIIAAAVILPLYFLVINKPSDNDAAQPSNRECGCTTTSIDTPNSTVSNVTIGQAVPRLLEDAQANFSIPLSAMTLLAKFNSGNLSCNTQNALVTFDGQALREEGVFFEIEDETPDLAFLQADGAPSIMLLPEMDTTLMIGDPAVTDGASFVPSTYTSTSTSDSSVSTILEMTLSSRGYYEVSQYPTGGVPSPTTTTSSTQYPTGGVPSPTTTTSSSATTTPQPTPTFTLDGQVLDFARVAVLYIFQEETFNDATTAQASLDRFFSEAYSDNASPGVIAEQAANVSIGGDNTIDLVNLFLDLGADRIGGGPSS